jgi:hypothetical protein
MRKSFIFPLIVQVLVVLGSAQAQVPATLISAKTTCIKLLYGSSHDTAAAKNELRKWGHYKLLNDCSKADMSLWIAAGSPAKEHVCHVTVQAIAPNQQVLWSETRDCKGTTPPTVAQLVRRLRADVSAKKK